MNPSADITALLEAWNQGDLEARDQLIPAVYDELRRRAAAFLRRERAGQMLQPTALVHEVYLRLVDQDRAVWQNRAQFVLDTSLATTMRDWQAARAWLFRRMTRGKGAV